MLRTLKIIEVPLNSSFTKAVCDELSKVIDDLKFIHKSEDNQSDFESLSKFFLTSDYDFFTWEASDLPDKLPKGLDYFFIPELEAVIIFKDGDDLF